jgi:rhodanese-related sulfurtransferase
MQRRHFVLGLVAAVALFACKATQEPSPAELRPLTVDQVSAKLGTPGFFVFDANLPESYANAHVPGAKLVDDENVTAAELPAAKDATLVFYCHDET